MDFTNKSPTWLIVGLGNPEPEYNLTRHNVGFDTLDALNTKKEKWQKSIHTLWCLNWYHHGIMIKPIDGMNLSGLGVQDVYNCIGFYDASKVIVIHDDMDFEPGQVRIKLGGGDGRHNGLKSIIQKIGKDFIRIRIGIGKPPKGQGIDFVLGRFSNNERKLIEDGIQLATEAVSWIVQDGVHKAMNHFNQRG